MSVSEVTAPWRHAVVQTVPRDHRARAEELASMSLWPPGWSDGRTRLTAYTAFIDGTRLVRVFDLEPMGSDVPQDAEAAWSRFLASALAELDEVARAEAEALLLCGTGATTSSRAGTADALARASVPAFAGRITPLEALPGTGVRERALLRYPVLPGRGAQVQAALSGRPDLPVRATSRTALASTSLFREGDLVLRLVEVAGDLADGFAHLRATASRGPAAQDLVSHLREGFDLRTNEGFDRFLASGRLRRLAYERLRDIPATASSPRGKTP
ncbi:SchA/CurD-like domain-containing protein [Nocardiopsis sp. LDBS1602]|nr:SchA/CurD-like domain-containing protein [Nocardiopsis sp. LDBS1602]MEC3894048.1 SchA/CurD-like domain-containing protein [Nocardiopsis sp. LDBS1602]